MSPYLLRRGLHILFVQLDETRRAQASGDRSRSRRRAPGTPRERPGPLGRARGSGRGCVLMRLLENGCRDALAKSFTPMQVAREVGNRTTRLCGVRWYPRRRRSSRSTARTGLSETQRQPHRPCGQGRRSEPAVHPARGRLAEYDIGPPDRGPRWPSRRSGRGRCRAASVAPTQPSSRRCRPTLRAVGPGDAAFTLRTPAGRPPGPATRGRARSRRLCRRIVAARLVGHLARGRREIDHRPFPAPPSRQTAWRHRKALFRLASSTIVQASSSMSSTNGPTSDPRIDPRVDRPPLAFHLADQLAEHGPVGHVGGPRLSGRSCTSCSMPRGSPRVRSRRIGWRPLRTAPR